MIAGGGGILIPYSSVLRFVLWTFNGYCYNAMLINVLIIKDFLREIIYKCSSLFKVRDTFYSSNSIHIKQEDSCLYIVCQY